MNYYNKLRIWQEAISIAKNTYELTSELPSDEKYGLKVQMQKCAVSISSNIAEGAGRNNKLEFRQFIGIASGSAFELESQTYLCIVLGLIDEPQGKEHISNIGKLCRQLYRFRQSLDKK